MKSLNLRHRQACSQNKALSRASPLWTHPSPTGDRQARAARVGRGNRGPREASFTKLQAGFIANQDSLGFWMVDILQEGRSQRSTPQERHTAHLRRHAGCTHRIPSGWNWEGDESQRLHSPSTWSPELLRPGTGTKSRPNQVCTFVEYPRT